MAKTFFISYSRGEADTSLAQTLKHGLVTAGHDVFIDTEMRLGTKWDEEIPERIASSEFFVLLLSSRSVHSEMVREETRLAREANKALGRPQILPIRVKYAVGPLGFALEAWVGSYQSANWEGEDDNGRVLLEILDASGRRLTQRAPRTPYIIGVGFAADPERPEPVADLSALNMPGGSIRPDDKFYVERPADVELAEAAQRLEETVVIKAPRQLGKSSLLLHYLTDCRRRGKKTALVDLSLFDDTLIADYPAFLTSLARELLDGFGLNGQPRIADQPEMTRFVRDNLLSAVPENVVIALDEVDRVLGQTYQSGFFSMLRSWIERRSDSTKPDWARLELALVISTEPSLLIADAQRSPFNVRVPVELAPFSKDKCLDLNHRYCQVLTDEQAEKLRAELLFGHPFLTRLAYYRLTHPGPPDLDALLLDAAEPDGPFSDHLRALLAKLRSYKPKDLLAAIRQVIRHGTVPDDDTFYRLRGAGLVRRERTKIVPANGLYARFFGNLP